MGTSLKGDTSDIRPASGNFSLEQLKLQINSCSCKRFSYSAPLRDASVLHNVLIKSCKRRRVSLEKDAAAPGIVPGDIIVLCSILAPPNIDPVSCPVLRNALREGTLKP